MRRKSNSLNKVPYKQSLLQETLRVFATISGIFFLLSSPWSGLNLKVSCLIGEYANITWSFPRRLRPRHTPTEEPITQVIPFYMHLYAQSQDSKLSCKWSLPVRWQLYMIECVYCTLRHLFPNAKIIFTLFTATLEEKAHPDFFQI